MVGKCSRGSTRVGLSRCCRYRGCRVLDVGGSLVNEYSPCVDCGGRSSLGQDARTGTAESAWSV